MAQGWRKIFARLGIRTCRSEKLSLLRAFSWLPGLGSNQRLPD
jgi:hypothetical protein